MPFVPPSPACQLPRPFVASARLVLAASCFILGFPLSVYENIINRRRFIVKRKAPEIPHKDSRVLLGHFQAQYTMGEGRRDSVMEGRRSPLRPPPLRQYITGLIFCQDLFLNFREFYSAISSPTVRTPSFCVLTCASICVVSHVLRLPYAVVMKSFASWRIICRAVS